MKSTTRLSFRGRDRKLVRELKKKLLQIIAMDQRRSDAAARDGVPPILFALASDTTIQDAIDKLVVRSTMALDERVSLTQQP